MPEDAREDLKLDEPIFVQYGNFLWQLVGHQSLGKSYVTKQDVNDIVKAAAPVTAALVFGGAVLWMFFGVTLGVLSAVRPRSLFDRVAMVFVLIGVSAHPVWLGLIFSYVFGFKLGWLPITGYCDFFNPETGNAVVPAHGSPI